MKINPTAAYYAYNKISEHLRPVHAEEAAGAPVSYTHLTLPTTVIV